MTEILYVSPLCSKKVLDFIFKSSSSKPQLAAQKFHKLLSSGFGLHQKRCNTQTLNTIPVTPQNHNKRFWRLPSEKVGNVKYHYIPILNIGLFKNVGVFLYTFSFTFFWGISKKQGAKKAVFCDILNLSTSAASLIACKFTGITCIGIVTDIPGMLIVDEGHKMGFKGKLYGKLVKSLITKFSGYILLTEQMNPVVNPKEKPYMIMEGLVDSDMKNSQNQLNTKSKERIVLYAGGLFEKYGVKALIEAFMRLEDPSVRLHLYGSGDMVEELGAYQNKDSRIHYFGIVPNQEVVAEQLKASLLVNPRPTKEEFTKYSFPSKNMEYLVSGTPMVVTKLPGMPEEYYPYLYLFEDESVEGMYQTFHNILSKSGDELHRFGLKAKEFVLQKKNNKIQAGRVLDFVSTTF